MAGPSGAGEALRRPGGGRYDQEVIAHWRNDPNHDLDYPYYGFETVDLAADREISVETDHRMAVELLQIDPVAAGERMARCADQHHRLFAVDAKFDGEYDKTGLPDPLILTSYFALEGDAIVTLIIIQNRPAA